MNSINIRKPPEGLKAVVFDMDGVLIDSEPVHYESTLRLFTDEFGLEFNESINHEFLGSTDRHMFEVLRERYGLSPSVEDLIARRKVKYMKLLEDDGIPWRDGIPDLISELCQAGYRLAVASSGLIRIIEYVLKTGNVRDRFEVVVSGDQITNPKPAPDIYLEAARRLNVDPRLCAAIEDTDVGVRACKAAGMYAIAFPCPTTAGQDFTPADTIIMEAAQIRQVLRL